MNAVPAKVAGVPLVVMVVPSPKGELNPLGTGCRSNCRGRGDLPRRRAQAVAALAYGTSSISPVAKIVGPGTPTSPPPSGRCLETVGIDSIAGPSEALVIADHDNNAEWLAADLLAEAEHDTAAQAILMTDDEGLAAAVELVVVELTRRHGGASPAKVGTSTAPSSCCGLSTTRRRWPIASPPASRDRHCRAGRTGRQDTQRRRDLPGGLYARGDRRRRLGFEPRPADCRPGSPPSSRPRHARLHEAIVDPEAHARGSDGTLRASDDTGTRRRPRSTPPLGRNPLRSLIRPSRAAVAISPDQQ